MLGLCHGTRFDGTTLRFYFFDNVTPQQNAELTNLLQTFQGERTEALHSNYRGLGRAFLGLALCFLTVLLCSKLLLKLRWTKFSVPSVNLKQAWLLLGFPLGLVLGGQHLTELPLYLFTATGILVIWQLSKTRPSEKVLSRAFAGLNFFRLMWLGSLTSSLSGVVLFTLEVPERIFHGPILLAAVILSYLPLIGKSWLLFKPDSKALSKQCQFGFHLGWMESTGLLVVLYFLCFVEGQAFQGTLAVLSAYVLGRLVHSALLWTALRIEPEKPELSDIVAPMRVAAGCWFLAPLPYLEVFWRGDSSLVLFWLCGLLALALYGRPWGSTVAEVKTLRYELSRRHSAAFGCKLTPSQKAAVLFMSLPPEMSAQLFSELGPEEVQAITLEITQLPTIPPEIRAQVIGEFLSMPYNRKRG